MAGLTLVTPPTHEPLEVVEAKEYLRVTGSAEDRLIATLIREARQQFDGPMAWFSRALITQTWLLTLDQFPQIWTGMWPYADPHLYPPKPGITNVRQDSIVVPLPPLQSVTSITYLDNTGSQQVLDPATYVVDTKSEPGEIYPIYGTVWPVTQYMPNAVSVTFVAGYGNAPTVPEAIKVWMKQVVAYRYDNRSLLTQLPTSMYWSMANYKVAWLA
jgi:hypothetical protein